MGLETDRLSSARFLCTLYLCRPHDSTHDTVLVSRYVRGHGPYSSVPLTPTPSPPEALFPYRLNSGSPPTPNSSTSPSRPAVIAPKSLTFPEPLPRRPRPPMSDPPGSPPRTPTSPVPDPYLVHGLPSPSYPSPIVHQRNLCGDRSHATPPPPPPPSPPLDLYPDEDLVHTRLPAMTRPHPHPTSRRSPTLSLTTRVRSRRNSQTTPVDPPALPGVESPRSCLPVQRGPRVGVTTNKDRTPCRPRRESSVDGTLVPV